MSEFCKPIEQSFSCRSYQIIDEYAGDKDATLLINCLLGLLVIPFEKNRSRFKKDKYTSELMTFFERMQAAGKYTPHEGNENPYLIIRCLRNAIAHCKFSAYPSEGSIEGFCFVSTRMLKYCEEVRCECQFKNVPMENGPEVFRMTLSISDIKELARIIKQIICDGMDPTQCAGCDYRPPKRTH